MSNIDTQPQSILTESDLADQLKVSTKLLQKMRQEGTGPKYVKIGRLVRYRRQDIEAYLEKFTLNFSHEEHSA